jgi:hypothetical protein
MCVVLRTLSLINNNNNNNNYATWAVEITTNMRY